MRDADAAAAHNAQFRQRRYSNRGRGRTKERGKDYYVEAQRVIRIIGIIISSVEVPILTDIQTILLPDAECRLQVDSFSTSKFQMFLGKI